MTPINQFLERYAHFLWLITAYLGIAAISTTSRISFDLVGIYLFVTGVLNLAASYGIFKKLGWGWKIASYAAILNLIYLTVFMVPVGVLINLLILYVAVRFKAKIGGKSGESLVPDRLQKYLP